MHTHTHTHTHIYIHFAVVQNVHILKMSVFTYCTEASLKS
jgi:hypothetical protein